ncbi:zinc finger, CCHC-type, retrotransposon gag domain protein [Tanacetum coccineum]|uniref:Zinc finger, CCHC-type, retrotransposon gag domain protein n=1 Tax=Tanacetum coccineum TaxID=301880 RepID=A0ABQ5DNA6_9ASTR
MVNTRTDAELAAAVQAAVDAMLPQIREQVREEYRTGAVASGSNPPPVTIHTWLERFNKQKPRSFEKAVAPVDAENWISHMEKIFDVMDCNDAFKTRLAVYKFEGDALAWWKAYKQAKGGDAWVLTLTWAAFKELFFLQFFPRAEQERLKREYHSIRQRASENSTEYMQRFLRLAGFLGQAAGTAEEQAKNFRWGLHKSILDHVMCIQFTDVAQVADAARNLEILRDRDDYDRSERSDKRHKSGDRYQSDTQQNNYRSHDQKNDRQGSDRQGGGGNYRNNNNNKYSRDNNRSNLNRYRLYLLYDMNLTSRHGNRNSGAGRDQRNRGSQQSRVPSEGYTHPVCNTCGRRHPGECRRAAELFKCGQAGSSSARLIRRYTGAEVVRSMRQEARRIRPCLCTYSDQAANTSDLPEYLLFRDVEFNIELIPGAEPISKAPYRMAPIELKELKDQLQGVVGARFYSPECIAMGCTRFWFVKEEGRIKCAPFEMLDGRKCRASYCLDQGRDQRILEGPEMIEVTNEKVAVAREKLKEAQTSVRRVTHIDKTRRAVLEVFRPVNMFFLESITYYVRQAFWYQGKLNLTFQRPLRFLIVLVRFPIVWRSLLSYLMFTMLFHEPLLQSYKYPSSSTLSLIIPIRSVRILSITEEP